MPKEAIRAYIYRIIVAIFALLVIRGIVSADEVPLWLELAAAILGLGSAGLAALNTSTKASTKVSPEEN